jgi:hypothetical protein
VQQANTRIDGIYTWDWRYRVGFDRELSGTILSACKRLPPQQRIVLAATHAWATSFVSLDALIDAVGTGTIDPEAIHTVQPDAVLHLPADLAPWIQSKARQYAARIGSSGMSALENLIEIAATQPYLSKHLDLFSLVFGDELDALLQSAANNVLHDRPAAKTITRDEIIALTEDFGAQLLRSPRTARWITSHGFPHFTTKFVADDGWYGEYWPIDLAADAVDDQLIIYTGEQNRDEHALLSTLSHEVFPGHGLFYKLIKEKNASFIDHGATCLIEGWATWCDWHTFENAYAAHSRSLRIESLKFVRETSPQAIIAAADRLAHFGQLATRREQRLATIFQYPGLSLSYALGALWFERHLDQEHPAAIFDQLTGKPWGDFFSSWSDQDATLSIASDYLSRG